MDYFKQRRAYRNFKIYETDVSIGQNDLYRELLDYANDEGKLDDEFPVKNSALVSLTGLSLAGVKTARNALQQMGLIEYAKGRKNSKAPGYRIVPLYGGMATSKATREVKSSPASTPTVAQKVAIPVAQTVAHKDLTSTDPDLTGTDLDEDDAGITRANVIDKWTELWGFPNGIAMPELDDWFKALPPDVIDFAINIAGEHNVKSSGALKYMRAVIEGWQKRDISTLDQAQKAAEEHDRRMRNARGGSKPTRAKETLPKWAQKAPEKTTDQPTTKQFTEEQKAAVAERIARFKARRSEKEGAEA